MISGFELLLASSETFRRFNKLEFSLTADLLNIRIRTSDGPLWLRNKPWGYQKYKGNFDNLNRVSFSAWRDHHVWVCVYFNYGSRWIVNNLLLPCRISRNYMQVNFVQINWF